jgi:hypothetical protein
MKTSILRIAPTESRSEHLQSNGRATCRVPRQPCATTSEPRPIEPPPPPEPETPRPEESARATPTEFSLEAIVWGAPRLDKLIEAHFPSPDQHEDKLNPAFIEALEQIFAENGVPWSDKPLLPIMSNAANSEAPASR